MTDLPLILVTRPAGAGDPLVTRLLLAGYRVAAVPTVLTRPAAPGGPLDDALADPRGWHWIVATSPTGAGSAAEAIARIGPPRIAAPGTGEDPAAAGVRWAAVGPATARALRANGIVPALVPSDPTSAGVARALLAREDLAGRRILLARADAAASDLPSALRAAGAEIRDVVAYHTVEAPPESAGPLAEALADPGLAGIVVASGSAARGLVRLVRDGELVARALATPLVSIGPSTSAVARSLGFVTVIQADRPSPDSLAEAVRTAVPATSPVVPPTPRHAVARRLP
jgi:uroporphyrinogen-III synthase